MAKFKVGVGMDGSNFRVTLYVDLIGVWRPFASHLFVVRRGATSEQAKAKAAEARAFAQALHNATYEEEPAIGVLLS